MLNLFCVLASFVLLLSSVVSEQVNLNATSDHLNATSGYRDVIYDYLSVTSGFLNTTSGHLNLTSDFAAADYLNVTSGYPDETSVYMNTTFDLLNRTSDHLSEASDLPSVTSDYADITPDHQNSTSDYLSVSSDLVSATVDYLNVTSSHPNATSHYLNAASDHLNTTSDNFSVASDLQSVTSDIPKVTANYLNETSDSLDVTSGYANTTTEFSTASTMKDTVDDDSIQLMNLPFSQGLSNPCSWEGDIARQNYVNIEAHRARFIQEYYRFVAHYARVYREEVQGMLLNHTITGCSTLHVNDLPNTPTAEELQGLNIDEAMNKIYLSLLIHSAYSYFIHYQFISSSVRCSNSINGEQSLANQALTMAYKQKALACYIRVGMAVLGYSQDDVLPFLNDAISGVNQCSRRALRDCQVMKSLYNLMGTVYSYASESDTTSSTVLPSTMGDKR